MDDHDREHALTQQITIFSVSSAMVGVCLTAISLILVVEKLGPYRTACDTLLVADMIVFLMAALFSYLAFRSRFRGRWRQYHLAADLMTFMGMAFLVVTSVLLVLALI